MTVNKRQFMCTVSTDDAHIVMIPYTISLYKKCSCCNNKKTKKTSKMSPCTSRSVHC